jgi:prophage antirepressor-like protein
MTCINESGLYSLVLTSRKPEAKRFKKWLTSQVIPAIRKTGSYSVQQKPQHQQLWWDRLVLFQKYTTIEILPLGSMVKETWSA